jgi:hypothetical protein
MNPSTSTQIPSATIQPSASIQITAPQFTEYIAPNPYYIHPSDCPSLVLVTPLLDANNYQTWSRSMRIALSCKHKEQFIDPTALKPDPTDRMYEP